MSKQGRYGHPDEKGTEFLIKSGLDYINELFKDKESKDTLISEINKVRDILYDDGRVLPDKVQVRFEKRLNSLETKIMK